MGVYDKAFESIREYPYENYIKPDTNITGDGEGKEEK